MKLSKVNFAIFISAALLQGCATTSVDPVAEKRFLEHHLNQSKSEARQKNYYEAAIHLKILQGLEGAGGQVNESVAKYEKLAAAQSQKLLKSALRSKKKGHLKSAEKYAIQSLQAKPDNEASVDLLRELYVHKLKREQLKKNRSLSLKKQMDQLFIVKEDRSETRVVDTRTKPNKAKSSKVSEPVRTVSSEREQYAELFRGKQYEKLVSLAESQRAIQNTEVKRLIVNSYVILAQRDLSAKRYDKGLERVTKGKRLEPNSVQLKQVETELRQAYAQNMLERGKLVFNKDMAQAIRYWEKGLAVEVNSPEIRVWLERAKNIQRNLEKIQSR